MAYNTSREFLLIMLVLFVITSSHQANVQEKEKESPSLRSPAFEIALDTLQNQIYYKFVKLDLLRRAMTHASYSQENNKAFSILGQTVIENSVSLYSLLQDIDITAKDLNNNISEISKVETSCAFDGLRLSLQKVVRVSSKTNSSTPAVVCGAFRAIFGAIAIDTGNSDDAGNVFWYVHGGGSGRAMAILDMLCGPDGELPEKLRNLEPCLIEHISNEIMDQDPNVRWEDIAGLDHAKTCVTEMVIWPLLRPDIFKGCRSPGRGLLLFGRPGTGKTMIGKAIAGEAKATFFYISASSLTSKWIGEGEKLVRALFGVASCRQPAVIFVDEIDSLLSQHKSEGEHESSRRLKTQFLIEMEGFDSGSEQILLIGDLLDIYTTLAFKNISDQLAWF